MSVHMAVLSDRTSLVLALTMLVPDWEVDAVLTGDESPDLGQFDAIVIEAPTTEDGLRLRATLESPPYTVVVGDAVPGSPPPVDVDVVARPFTVADLRDLIQSTVAPAPPEPAPQPASKRQRRKKLRRRRTTDVPPAAPPVWTARDGDMAPGAPPAPEAAEPPAEPVSAIAEPASVGPLGRGEGDADDVDLRSEVALWEADKLADEPTVDADRRDDVSMADDAEPVLFPPAVTAPPHPDGLREATLDLDDQAEAEPLPEAAPPEGELDTEASVAPSVDAVPLPSIVVDLSALERPVVLEPVGEVDEADDDVDAVIEVLGGYEYREPVPVMDDLPDEVAKSDPPAVELDEQPSADPAVGSDDSAAYPAEAAADDVEASVTLPPPPPAATPARPAITAPPPPPPPPSPEPDPASTTDAGPVPETAPAQAAAADPEGSRASITAAARDRLSAWRDRHEADDEPASPSPAETWTGVIDAVALLAETLNAFDPVTAAVWVQGSDGIWRAEAHLGLRPAESRRSVSPDQPMFSALTANRHGLLLSPADYARGYLGGIPGTWTQDVIAAAVPGPKGSCLAIVVVGADELTPRTARRLVALAEEAGAPARRYGKALASLGRG